MYTCPLCRLKEIGSGMHVPLPKTATFDAKDLPRTMLSDHIERRLFKRLMQESKEWAKVEGNKNLDEVRCTVQLKMLRFSICMHLHKHFIFSHFLILMQANKWK